MCRDVGFRVTELDIEVYAMCGGGGIEKVVMMIGLENHIECFVEKSKY